ncbi:MAG: phosphatidate cytidylyltransferase [Bdellovibrio sp.]
MTAWKSFLTRALSAIAALIIIFVLFSVWSTQGLKFLILLAVLVGTQELVKILFPPETSLFIKILFYILSILIFAGSSASLMAGSLIYSLALVIMITAVLLSAHKSGQLVQMTQLHLRASMGFFYMGLLPSFSYKILDHGLSWFAFLLIVVFAGDTLAYVAGVLFGRHKIMPSVSPKKTWQGSVGGLFGALLAGFLCWYYLFPEASAFYLMTLAALAGFAGQFGDFFESLLKRVADVKDSGKIMPGHGGILDRIDGVLFASPVILSGILILSHLLS